MKRFIKWLNEPIEPDNYIMTFIMIYVIGGLLAMLMSIIMI